MNIWHKQLTEIIPGGGNTQFQFECKLQGQTEGITLEVNEANFWVGTFWMSVYVKWEGL